ncbi:MAG: hypothetical protein ABI586_10515, partial [Candidatus Nanopelagicales bacterium]
MRIEAKAISVSWIPNESVQGPMRAGFELGAAHYDSPPPDRIKGVDHINQMCEDDAFRFSNVLSGWVDVEDGKIVASGLADESGLVIGSTTVRLGQAG